MAPFSPRRLEFVSYAIGALIAVVCNTTVQWFLLARYCIDNQPGCKLIVAALAVAVSFCVKYAWDNFIVFGRSRADKARKRLAFLASSVTITSLYLAGMTALAMAGASNRLLIQAGWVLFSLGYLAKYVLDKRFAFIVD